MTILSYGCLRLQIGCKIVNIVCHMIEVNSCLYKLSVWLMRLLDCNEVHRCCIFIHIDIKLTGCLITSILRFARNAGLLSYLCSYISSTESMGTFIICAFAYVQAGN